MAEQKATAVFLLRKEAIDAFLLGFKAALADRLRRIHDGFAALREEGFRVDVLAPEAAIYLTVKIDLVGKRIKDQQEVTSFLLNEAGLAVVPFSAFGAPKTSPWYRLSVGTCRLEDIPRMLGKLKEAMERLD